MIPFPLKEAVLASGGVFFGDAALLDAPVTNVCIDSRAVTDGALYVPIRGERLDGHMFIEAAMHNGALCTLSAKELPVEPYILVDDTTAALQALAAHYREKFDIPVIGVTGSVGKTSTKEMLAAVLSARFHVLKTPGNLNNQTGVPQTLFLLGPEDEAAVVEMGTNHFGEIRALSRMVQPTICLFTNIGVSHIEFFGSREGILRGKSEMLEHMRPGGRIIVNGDDDMLMRVENAVRYGEGAHCDVRASEIEDRGLDGMAFTAHFSGQALPIHIPAPGMHMVQNALAAIAVGACLGMTPEQLQQGAESYAPLSGRMNIKKTPLYTVIDDSYNASPTATMASIDVLSRVDGRRVAILGDMLELGRDSEEFHEVVGMYAAMHGVDLILCVGPNAEMIFMGAHELAPRSVRYFETQESLISILPYLLQSGDTILVKASRGMHLEITVHYLLTAD